MSEIFETVVRVAVWSGIFMFTWSVSSSLEKIANSLSKNEASEAT